jgi:hypothetical protein
MKIRPHLGAGPVDIGMTRAEVARVMGAVPDRRNSETERDWFAEADMFVEYDVDGRVSALEFGRGGARLDYDGYILFDHPALAVREWAARLDPLLERRDGFTSAKLGLSMYAPDIDDLEEDEVAAPAEGFMVFKPGYAAESRRRIELLRAAKRGRD